jgi:hypothetical protein
MDGADKEFRRPLAQEILAPGVAGFLLQMQKYRQTGRGFQPRTGELHHVLCRERTKSGTGEQ